MLNRGGWEEKSFAEGMRVFSCGHVIAELGRSLNRPLGTEFHKLLYIAAGEVQVGLPGGTVTARRGSFLFFAPHQPLHQIAKIEKSEFYYSYIRFEDERTAETLFPVRTQFLYESVGSHCIPLFQGIIEELQFQKPFYRELSVAKMKELLFLLRRRVYYADAGFSTANRQIYRLISLFHTDRKSRKTLDGYAEELGYSKFTLIRLFKQQTGMTPMEYRNRIRLHHACEMLEEGCSVSEAAEESGFSSVQYFYEAFSKEYGCSPSAYRKEKRGKTNPGS